MTLIERLKKIDYEYSYKLANLLSMKSPIRTFFQLITQTGTFIAWGIGLSLTFIFVENYRIETLSLIFISGFMVIPVFVIKQIVRRNRPEYKDDRFGTIAFDKFSFPSGHATRATYAMIILPIYMPSFTLFWIIWGLIMIASRLILGVHYISDIITGIFLGAIFMILFILLDWIPIIPFIANLF